MARPLGKKQLVGLGRSNLPWTVTRSSPATVAFCIAETNAVVVGVLDDVVPVVVHDDGKWKVQVLCQRVTPRVQDARHTALHAAVESVRHNVEAPRIPEHALWIEEFRRAVAVVIKADHSLAEGFRRARRTAFDLVLIRHDEVPRVVDGHRAGREQAQPHRLAWSARDLCTAQLQTPVVPVRNDKVITAHRLRVEKERKDQWKHATSVSATRRSCEV